MSPVCFAVLNDVAFMSKVSTVSVAWFGPPIAAVAIREPGRDW